MIHADEAKILIIDEALNEDLQVFVSMLTDRYFDVVIEDDLATAIQRVQVERFNVAILDANISMMPIERTIQILKNIDPSLKIIVKTAKNTRELEAKVRRASVYYYHLNSFGWDDLVLAIESAIDTDNCAKLAEQGAASRKVVYIIDEDDTFIEIHETNLVRNNFCVKIFYDLDKAINAIRKHPPDVLIIDMDVPLGSDRKHFLEKLFESFDEVVRIPMLLYSAEESYGRNVKVLDALRLSLPNYFFLKKPVKIEDVIPKIQRLLAFAALKERIEDN